MKHDPKNRNGNSKTVTSFVSKQHIKNPSIGNSIQIIGNPINKLHTWDC